LDRVLENALKDTLKADGQGDFFDQTSKKKHKDDEPEKHCRVDVDHFRGVTDNASEPDSAVSDTAERVRKHKDDAFEAMIRFIDSLPEIKRSAVYASAFGQILRPELQNYGRNYAEILASTYHTTALYIRQLATEGKKAALAEARRLGFGERSMNDVLIGMIQEKVNIPLDPNEAVLQATDKLDSYQQFMLLRHLANDKEGNDDKETDTSIGNNTPRRSNGSLTPKEEAEQAELSTFMDEMAGYATQFLSNAKKAFWDNDRYSCAVYYTLLAIAKNQEEVKDIEIKRFLMENVFFKDSKVTADLSLDESQKKKVSEAVFDRSSNRSLGYLIRSLDFRQVEKGHLPFFISLDDVTFFDWIGICLNKVDYPDLFMI
ncbi:MAG: hypothetical protein II730_06895, partial [Bacteroidales bacterium]|nr:hypothetical protein [Bacteroidales bacterium]